MRTHLSAVYRGEVVILPIADVSRFVAEHKYVTAHHTGGELIIEDPIYRLEAELPEFVRISRSRLVRVSTISRLVTDYHANRHTITVAGVPEPILVSRRLAPAVRRRLREAGEK